MSKKMKLICSMFIFMASLFTLSNNAYASLVGCWRLNVDGKITVVMSGINVSQPYDFIDPLCIKPNHTFTDIVGKGKWRKNGSKYTLKYNLRILQDQMDEVFARYGFEGTVKKGLWTLVETNRHKPKGDLLISGTGVYQGYNFTFSIRGKILSASRKSGSATTYEHGTEDSEYAETPADVISRTLEELIDR